MFLYCNMGKKILGFTNNEKILKGKSRLIIKQFSSENVSIYWNIDLSTNDPSGNIIIELVGRGPQIELIPIK